MRIEALDRLCALAVNCRERADTATDPEVAKALRYIATDMEATAAIIESVMEAKEGGEG